MAETMKTEEASLPACEVRLTPEEREHAFACLGVPAVALPYADVFYSEAELALAARLPGAPFTAQDASRVLGDAVTTVQAAELLRAAHHRGVVDLADADGTERDAEDPFYAIGTFYSRLDVFAISEQELWQIIPREARRAMDEWYFDAYMEGMDPDRSVVPTEDAVLSLEETLAKIDADPRQIYLNTCDCRSLAGDCGLPTRTCLTYKDGPNSFCGRGLSQALTKEEAKDVVREADRAGLMHTANPNGICNCCGDCCYLFRGQRYRDSLGIWPIAPHIIHLDADACIGCGRCVKRCHFGVFTLMDAPKAAVSAGDAPRRLRRRVAKADTSTCVGCGICANTCPVSALTLFERSAS